MMVAVVTCDGFEERGFFGAVFTGEEDDAGVDFDPGEGRDGWGRRKGRRSSLRLVRGGVDSLEHDSWLSRGYRRF